jgi:hypothetical protein
MDEQVSLDAAVIAAAQLTHAHIVDAIAAGARNFDDTRGVLALFGSYVDEIRSGGHLPFRK